MINWQWLSFEQLSRAQLYELLTVRQAVFVVEQNCIYQDLDHLDQYAWHLLGWQEISGQQKLAAYLRVLFPGKKYREPTIGRVLTSASARGSGLGRELMRKAIENTAREYPGMPIRISAQQYLEKFYGDFGFNRVSEPYAEDGIPHVEMLREPEC